MISAAYLLMPLEPSLLSWISSIDAEVRRDDDESNDEFVGMSEFVEFDEFLVIVASVVVDASLEIVALVAFDAF